MTATAAVDATGLVKTFGRLRAVDGIDLHVCRGEIVVAAGPYAGRQQVDLPFLGPKSR
jgi:ABC-2 type transport system ATP-binding protein